MSTYLTATGERFMESINRLSEWMQRHKFGTRLVSGILIQLGVFTIGFYTTALLPYIISCVCYLFFSQERFKRYNGLVDGQYQRVSDTAGAAWCLTVLWRGAWHIYEYGWRKVEDEQITPIVVGGTLLMIGAKGFELIFDW